MEVQPQQDVSNVCLSACRWDRTVTKSVWSFLSVRLPLNLARFCARDKAKLSWCAFSVISSHLSWNMSRGETVQFCWRKMKATCIMVFSFLACVCVFVGRPRGQASAFMRDPEMPKITWGSQLLIVTTVLRTAVVFWRIEWQKVLFLRKRSGNTVSAKHSVLSQHRLQPNSFKGICLCL